jgi:glycosyltransferase involved in cell wall biosynthesis
MKIITLLPVKNESWVLPFSLKNFELFSDEIVLLDDASKDSTVEIAKRFSKVSIVQFQENNDIVDMSKRRSVLLEEGRERGGTHFVFLDADEIFSQSFIDSINKNLSRMNPGDTMLLPWINTSVREQQFFYSPKEEKNYKDFIFCDDKLSTFTHKRLSEARTPGQKKSKMYVPFKDGFVIHLQYALEKRYHLKQAWYRMQELLEGKRVPKRINATYDFTKTAPLKNNTLLHETYCKDNTHLLNTTSDGELYFNDIEKLFDKHQVTTFEALDVWHVEELREEFERRAGRIPQPKTLPRFIITLNKIKNRIKNAILGLL